MSTINKEKPSTLIKKGWKLFMLKTTFKIFMLFLLLIVVAVSTGLATYSITRNIIENRSASAAQALAVSHSNETVFETRADNRRESINKTGFEYYLVRLDGENLEVYVSHGGEEEFLYSREVYSRDLSQDDLEMLNGGVKLRTASELTGFIENFTS